MTYALALLFVHIIALSFGLAGMLIALPNPSLWAGSPLGTQVFALGMQYSGMVQIVSGALATFALGVAWLGWRRTLMFFALSTVLSCGIELLGTGTGWPFGAYEYTDGLGAKIGSRVPFTIPLSWFTVGLVSYLLGISAVRRIPGAAWWLAAIPGIWLLTVWDLVLDPAMAHESLPLRFWVWHQTGPYFGMPIQNFIGWAGTGLLFMVLSGVLWGTPPAPSTVGTRIAFAIYLANILFAVVLSLSVSLWVPVALALMLGVLPAGVTCLEQPPNRNGLRMDRSWSPSEV
jgi:uncharacterized membrane protein